MGSFSIWHILIVVALLALLFGGRGKISGIMGDTAKGIRAFREGLKGEDEHKAEAEEDEPPPKPLPKAKAASAKPASTTSRAKPKAKTKVNG